MSKVPCSWVLSTFGELNRFESRTLDPSTRPNETFDLYSVPSFPSGWPERIMGNQIGSTKQTVAPDDVLVCKINPRINRIWHVGLTGVGGSLTRAQPKKVATYPVPVAPLAEQTRIADQLDKLLARIQACNDRLDAIPALLKRFRQAVLTAATSGALTEDWRAQREAPVARMEPSAESGNCVRDSGQLSYQVTPTPDSASLHPGYEAVSDDLVDEWVDTTIGAITVDLRYGTSKKCDYSTPESVFYQVHTFPGGLMAPVLSKSVHHLTS